MVLWQPMAANSLSEMAITHNQLWRYMAVNNLSEIFITKCYSLMWFKVINLYHRQIKEGQDSYTGRTSPSTLRYFSLEYSFCSTSRSTYYLGTVNKICVKNYYKVLTSAMRSIWSLVSPKTYQAQVPFFFI